MAKNYFKILIFLLAVAIIVPQIVFAAWYNPFSWGIWNKIFHFQKTEQQQGKVVCAMDTKLCSDGSYVSRHGAKCEFDACPTETGIGKCELDKDCPQIRCIKAHCPESKCINNTCQMGLFWDVVYPLYSGVNWETVGQKKNTVPASNIALEGYGLKGQGKINQNQDAQKFFDYYDKKLKAAGWSIENNFAADGVKGSQIGYKKDENYIVLSYNITPGKVTSKENEPLRWTCPCQVQYEIFTGIASVKNPVVSKNFVCDNNKSITANFNSSGVDIKLNDGRNFSLKSAYSVSGAKYTDGVNESFMFWSKGVVAGECTAFVMEKVDNKVTQTYTNCKCKN